MKVKDLFENRAEEAGLVLTGVKNGVRSPVPVVLNTEHALALYSGETLLHRFVCSPAGLGELCVGWLATAGYQADEVEISADGHAAVATGAAARPSSPEARLPNGEWMASPDEMLRLFREASEAYTRSHGVHACVIRGDGWHIHRTDIGRHNAMDKAVGAAVLAGYDLRGAVMFSSGRINVQTVRKAANCGAGCLMSKAVITREALQLAEELGLKVLFSVKENGYAAP